MARNGREIESKLNAESTLELMKLRNHILSDPHYVSTVEGPFLHPVFAQAQTQMLGKVQELTGIRIRTYYDNKHLAGYRHGVEIRVEPKDDGEYKLTVKFGSNRPGNGRFSRQEISVRLDSPEPDLEQFDAETRRKLCRAFGVKNVRKIKLRPMIEIVSQRWRCVYHPGGDPKTIIEYAQDVAQGRTFTGFSWPLYQAELEIKKGSRKALVKEEKRLLDTFNFLTRGTQSKPSPGFEVLLRQLASEEAQDFAHERLTPGRFRVYKQPAFTRIP